MSSATVTFTDGDDEEVTVSWTFDPLREIDDDASLTPAQQLAVDLLAQVNMAGEEDW